MAGILSGIRVVDLTQYLSGPQATLFLAGIGAEVIHVDNPATGDVTADSAPYLGPEGVSLGRRTPDDLGVPYLKRARGKRAVTLNLKHPEGPELLLGLVGRSDVVVENWTVGTAARLGVDYAACRAVKPDVVYCSITGFGQTGPEAAAASRSLSCQGTMPSCLPATTNSGQVMCFATSFRVSAAARSRASAGVRLLDRAWNAWRVSSGSRSKHSAHSNGPESAMHALMRLSNAAARGA